MIDMNELKPILEPLMNEENSADIIAQIMAIDRPGYSQADIDKVNADWNNKFKETFFGGSEPSDTPTESESDEIEQEEPTTYEELFKKEEE